MKAALTARESSPRTTSFQSNRIRVLGNVCDSADEGNRAGAGRAHKNLAQTDEAKADRSPVIAVDASLQSGYVPPSASQMLVSRAANYDESS